MVIITHKCQLQRAAVCWALHCHKSIMCWVSFTEQGDVLCPEFIWRTLLASSLGNAISTRAALMALSVKQSRNSLIFNQGTGPLTPLIAANRYCCLSEQEGMCLLLPAWLGVLLWVWGCREHLFPLVMRGIPARGGRVGTLKVLSNPNSSMILCKGPRAYK